MPTYSRDFNFRELCTNADCPFTHPVQAKVYGAIAIARSPEKPTTVSSSKRTKKGEVKGKKK